MPSRRLFGRSCGRSPIKHGSIGDVKPLRVSLGVLGVVVAFALAGLVLAENWSKLLRVGVAATVYLACMGLAARRSPQRHDATPWWFFALAGALAGLASGVLRPGHHLRPVLADMASAGLLLSTVHWLAVRYAPRLRARLTA